MVSRICRQCFRVGVANALFSSILTLGLGLKGAVTKKLLQTKIKPGHDNLDIFLFDSLSLTFIIIIIIINILYIYIWVFKIRAALSISEKTSPFRFIVPPSFSHAFFRRDLFFFGSDKPSPSPLRFIVPTSFSDLLSHRSAFTSFKIYLLFGFLSETWCSPFPLLTR